MAELHHGKVDECVWQVFPHTLTDLKPVGSHPRDDDFYPETESMPPPWAPAAVRLQRQHLEDAPGDTDLGERAFFG